MNFRQQQRGITFWGLCFMLGVLAFVVFLVFKLYPPYLDDFKVKTALSSVARQPDFGSMTRPEIVSALEKRFDVDDITHVVPNKDLIMETRGRTRLLRIEYERVIPIVGNLSILLSFNHIQETKE
jgi:hypothetical protein